LDGVGCHGVSFHARTDAGTLVLGLINAGTLTGTNAYDCVRDNTEHAVAHFSSKAILTLTINNRVRTIPPMPPIPILPILILNRYRFRYRYRK